MFSLIAHAIATGLPSGETTSPINTTGADLIVLPVGYSNGSTPAVSDNKLNTWITLPLHLGSGAVGTFIAYCLNPTVGSGHTFTVSGSNIFAPIEVSAWSGAVSKDQDTGAGAASTGSVTPTAANELIISSVVTQGSGSFAVDSSFTVLDSQDYNGTTSMGLGVGYLIQGAATPINPTWTVNTSGGVASAIATFKTTAPTGSLPIIGIDARAGMGMSHMRGGMQ